MATKGNIFLGVYHSCRNGCLLFAQHPALRLSLIAILGMINVWCSFTCNLLL
jgi:hypothetical protein